MTSAQRQTGLHGAVVLLLVFAWFAVTGWLRPLTLPDEGRYAGVAWEMLRSGDWLTPTLDGLPYFHKPPLFYWITGASLATFGLTEWAARLAPLLGATAGAFALYRFAQRQCGEVSARFALLALATQPLFFVGSQFANLDMLVAGCISVTVFALAQAVLQAQAGRPERQALALAYLFAALGILAKGLIGAVLPAMVVTVWLLALRRFRMLFALLWLPGIALFLCVAAPWFIAMQLRFDQFADYFFVVQHFKRFAQGGFNNAQPFWFYPAVLALLALPWSPWLAGAARHRYWADPQQGPVRKLMWLWLATITAFFSLPQSKLVGYILPAAAPLAFLIGDSAALGYAQSARLRRLWRFSAGTAGVVCLAVVIVATVYAPKSSRNISRILASRAAPGEPVIFLQKYFFDVPFYAALRTPALVVDEWDDPDLSHHDNWRKELFDARQFASPAAPPVLLLRADLANVLCHAGASWVVGHRRLAGQYPELAGGTEVAAIGEDALWRVPGRAGTTLTGRGCPEKPSASSAGK